MSRRLWVSSVALAAGAVLLVAAGVARSAGSADTGSEPRKGGTLRLSSYVDVEYVDPALAYNPWAAPIPFATCAKLFNYPDEAGAAGTRLIPEVASSMPTVSRDGRTYTFELRRTFRFHTGEPVTARSFADAFDRVANPRMKSDWAPFLHEIVGADAVLRGNATTISGVRVLGRYRLQIRLSGPVPDFTFRLALQFACPVLPTTPVDPAGTETPPGSGPYYVADWVRNRRIVLKRNPHYDGGRPANVDQVEWTIGESPETCRQATEENRIDYCVVTFFSDDAYRELHARYGLNRVGGRFFVTPTASTWYLAFNHERPAFKGPGQIALKKAINYAIDRPALVRAFGYLAGRRTDQILPPALGREESIYPLKGSDPVTARKWLARARRKPERLVLYTNNNPQIGGVAIAQALAFQLKQIGIELDVKYFELSSFFDKAGTRGEPFDLAFSGWTPDYPDGYAFFVPLLHGRTLAASGSVNFARFDDPTTNARIDAATRLGGAERRRAWAKLDSDLMRDNPPWAPVLNRMGRHFVSRSYGCFLLHPAGGVDIAAACKK